MAGPSQSMDTEYKLTAALNVEKVKLFFLSRDGKAGETLLTLFPGLWAFVLNVSSSKDLHCLLSSLHWMTIVKKLHWDFFFYGLIF